MERIMESREKLEELKDLCELSMQVWQELVNSGQYIPFYGVDNYRFKLDDMIFEALEDPSDGYRSYLGNIVIDEQKSEDRSIFFPAPVAHVKIVVDSTESTDFNGWTLVDTDGHIWLTVGTENSNDYYPWFQFTYCPKDPSRYSNTDKIPEVKRLIQAMNLAGAEGSDDVIVNREDLSTIKSTLYTALDCLHDICGHRYELQLIDSVPADRMKTIRKKVTDSMDEGIKLLKKTGRVF